MSEIAIITLLSFIGLMAINFIFKKKYFLIDNYKSGFHKINKKKNVVVSGGVFLSISFFFIVLYLNLSFSYFFLIFIFIIGILSDLNILNSPKIRLGIQSLFVILMIFILNLQINETRIDIIDYFINNNVFSFIFLACCLLVLINGANFIDGLNGLSSGYFILVLFTLLNLSNKNQIVIEQNYLGIFYFIIPLFAFFLFNLFGINFLGDSGSYFTATIVGYLAIESAFDNTLNLSPIFISILLWYPVFENLFSFIRRTVSYNSQTIADKSHLHHLLYYFISSKMYFKNQTIINSLSSSIIIFYNILIFIISSKFFNNSVILSSIIIFNIFIYSLVYLKLYKVIRDIKKI